MAGEERRDNGGLPEGVRGELSISLPFVPENWNSYIDRERSNKYAAAAVKKKEKNLVIAQCHGKRYEGRFPVQITFRPHFANHRRDLDNTRIKGVLDGLVACGVLPNDNLKHIQRIVLEPVFDGLEQIDIEIRELP